MRIALIGGTGRLGPGLARRWASARHDIVIGSREAERAEAAAREISDAASGGRVLGATNSGAAELCDMAVITVPYDAVADTIASLGNRLDSKIVISTVVPLAMQSGTLRFVPPEAGSAAQAIAAMLPRSRVTSAFHSVSSAELKRRAPIEGDSLVCGDDEEAVSRTADLVSAIPSLRAVIAGPLYFSAASEAMTSLLLSLNKRYKAHAGLQITGLPK